MGTDGLGTLSLLRHDNFLPDIIKRKIMGKAPWYEKDGVIAWMEARLYGLERLRVDE